MDLLILDNNILPYHGVLVGISDLMDTLEKAPTPTVGTNGSLVPKKQTPVRAGKRIRRKPSRFREPLN